MSDSEPPLLAALYPALVSFLSAELVARGEPVLERVVRTLRFHGWCACAQSCSYLRTAPQGRAGEAWIHLDDDQGTPLVWLQLDREHASFAGMEICEFELERPRA